MEDIKTDEKLADEAVNPEDAVSAEKEIESTETCAEEGTQEDVPNEEETGPAEEDSKAESGKKGFFGKRAEKKDPRDEKIEELTDRLQRTMAEFDNYRKRTEKEKSAMFEIGARDIIERILPVVDNFERGLAAVPEEEKGTPFADGMDKIYKQLMKTLEEAGIKPIEAVGKPFDPNFHNAVMHIEDESLGENTVSQELQKGYTYRDTVVRHSMVQVAN
ncbi:nucleotide exchange factor GrpE [Clostridium sp. Marseille-P2415]|uniref:nucleotide exchange factor GrpE n=1 Tax=Clostridium sp. Marseille-P2415 TaxID=1805471 RepID=UPI000988725C